MAFKRYTYKSNNFEKVLILADLPTSEENNLLPFTGWLFS